MLWGEPRLNLYIPEFLKWILPSFNLDTSILCKHGIQSTVIKMTSSVDPDEVTRYEPSYLDLHCSHRYLYRSTELNVVKYPCRIVQMGKLIWIFGVCDLKASKYH